MRRALPLLALAWLLTACAATDRRVEELQRQLQQRDAEIAALRRQLDPAAQQNAPAPPSTAEQPAPSEQEQRPTRGEAEQRPARSETKAVEEEEASRALERALVLQSGRVIPRGAVEIEPEISYFYSEPNGRRRDTFISVLTARVGLPWAAQAEVRVPYVIHDRLADVDSSSGVGDIELALTKQVLTEREFVPALLVSGRWKTTTGDSGGTLPTGTGANALQAALTAVKAQDPLVFFGTLRYTRNFPSGERDLGDSVGGKLGAFLVATPDTSLLLDVDVESSFPSRFGEQEITETDRLAGIVEIGLATIVTRATLLSITTGIGFTSTAPDFRLTVSLPVRF
jgi:hypothetical protein